MRTYLRSIRAAIFGPTRAVGQATVTRRRPFRLVAVVAALSLIGGTLAVLGLAPSAYAADSSSTSVSPGNPTIVLGAASTAVGHRDR